MGYSIKSQQNAFQNTPKFLLRGFFEKQKDCPEHLQEFTEIIFVLRGKANHYTPLKGMEEISRGDLLIIPSEGIHGYYDTKDLEIFNMLFVPTQLPLPLLELYSHPGYRYIFAHNLEFFELEGHYPHLLLQENEITELEYLLHLFVKIQEQRSIGCRCGLFGIFMTILYMVCDKWQAVSSRTDESTFDITKVLSYLNENHCNQLSLNELAQLANMSQNTLLRHFKKTFGYSPIDYINNLRLSIAATLLLNTTMRIGEIAAQVGFKSSSYFSKMFKQKHGCGPIEYRRNQSTNSDNK